MKIYPLLVDGIIHISGVERRVNARERILRLSRREILSVLSMDALDMSEGGSKLSWLII